MNVVTPLRLRNAPEPVLMSEQRLPAGMTPDERRRWQGLGGKAIVGSEAASFMASLGLRDLAQLDDVSFGKEFWSLTEAGERAFFGETVDVSAESMPAPIRLESPEVTVRDDGTTAILATEFADEIMANLRNRRAFGEQPDRDWWRDRMAAVIRGRQFAK
jgi:hypothetical protein